jgi:catalase
MSTIGVRTVHADRSPSAERPTGSALDQQQTADPNYATRDLYDNIRAGHFPKWDLFVQVLTAEQVAQLPYDGFDDTKTWETCRNPRLAP